jgi:outer membrane protein assembly factor BamB
MDQIQQHFPTRAGDSQDHMQSLGDWAVGRKQFCFDTFGAFESTLKSLLINKIAPHLGVVSQDQDFVSIWYSSLPNAGLHPANMVFDAPSKRLFAAAAGVVYELEPKTGEVLHWRRLTDTTGGPYETRLLVSHHEAMIYACVQGKVFGMALDDPWDEPRFSVSLPGASATTPGFADPGNLMVAYHGTLDGKQGIYLCELDVTGRIMAGPEFLAASGPCAVQMVGDEATDFYAAGAAGKVLGQFESNQWVYDTKAGPHPVNLVYAGGRLFAGCNGSVFEIDPVDGREVQPGLLLTSWFGLLDYETRLAVAGSSLFAGVHGYVYKVPLDEKPWSKVWEGVGVGETLYHPVSLMTLGDRLIAGCNGYVYEIDPDDGTILQRLLLPYRWGAGDYDTRLGSDGRVLFAGVHGYAYRVLPTEPVPVLQNHSALPDLPTARQLAAGCASDSALYLAGGTQTGVPGGPPIEHTFLRVSASDVLAGTAVWEVLPDVPTARWAASCVFAEDQVWVLGGHRGDSAVSCVEVFDPKAGRWSTGAPMPHNVSMAAAAYMDGRIVVSGGWHGTSRGFVDIVQAYDIAVGAWTSLAPMGTPKAGHGAAVVDGRLYAVGGDGADRVYDPIRNAWSDLPAQWPARPMPQFPWRLTPAVAAVGKKIYLFGAYSQSGFASTVWVYDTQMGTWSELAAAAHLAHAQGGAACAAAPLGALGAAVVVAGGAGKVEGAPTQGAELYLFE